jgi:FRG domain
LDASSHPDPFIREKRTKRNSAALQGKSVALSGFFPTNDWDWLALGQQYGLPTRLLDWTDNPLVACYFAVEELREDEGVIYAYQNQSYIEVENIQSPCGITRLANSFRNIFRRASQHREVFLPSIPNRLSLSKQRKWIRSCSPIAFGPP